MYVQVWLAFKVKCTYFSSNRAFEKVVPNEMQQCIFIVIMDVLLLN